MQQADVLLVAVVGLRFWVFNFAVLNLIKQASKIFASDRVEAYKKHGKDCSQGQIEDRKKNPHKEWVIPNG